MPYKDPEKAKQAAKDRMRKHRAQQEQGEHKEGEQTGRTFLDCCGTCHKISIKYNVDFEGRRKDWQLLSNWYEGKGTLYQQRIGALAMQYSVIKSDFDKPGKRAHYLGVAYAEPVVLYGWGKAPPLPPCMEEKQA